MHIYSHETERIHQLQRQLHDEEQFRALVRELRQIQRRCRRLFSGSGKVPKVTSYLRDQLEAIVDRQLGLLDGE